MKNFTVVFLFIVSSTVSAQVVEGKLLELNFSGGSNPKNITPGDTKMYLSAQNGYSGRELFVYDSVLDSIQLVKDIYPGWQSSIAENEESFICIGDELYFVALNQLWKSDGTEAGTTMVKNINPSGDSYIKNFTVLNGMLYFTAYDNTNFYRLWRSDGTSTGTYFLNIPQGPNGTQIFSLTVFENHLYFQANDGVNGYELWKSDGTAIGTFPLTNLNGSQNGVSFNSQLLEFNGHLYFYANDGVHGSELWRTNGTLAGTELFKDLNSGPQDSAYVLHGVATDNYFVFMASVPFAYNFEPWVSDGTASGTQLLKDIHPTIGSLNSTADFVAFNNNVFFLADDGVHGLELWKTDGTEAGTELLIDILPGSGGGSVNELTATTDFLIFSAYLPGNSYRSLWKSIGTEAGTEVLYDVDLTQNSATNLKFVEFQDIVYFAAGVETENGLELWSTAGTTANTGLFRDLRRNNGIGPVNFSVLDNNLVFIGAHGGVGDELFISEGTNQGTHIIKDIYPGEIGSMYSGTFTDKSFININEVIYFTARDPINGRELYRTDGTEQGTYIVKDIVPGPSNAFNNDTFFASMGSLLFFKANNQIHGEELWVSDGTETGTFMLKDIYPGSEHGFVTSNLNKHFEGYAVLNNELYFSAYDGNAHAIWKTDGTEAGTTFVMNIPNSGTLRIYGGNNDIMYVGTILNTNPGQLRQLWATDGTQQNLTLLYEVNSSESIRETYIFNGDLYFSAFSDVIGTTLYKTDGTPQGTIILSNDINLSNNLYKFNFGYFLECSGYLFFYTNNSTQFWRTDGTPAGTVMIEDYYYPNPSSLSDMVCFQDLVFYIEDSWAHTIKVTNGLNFDLEMPVELINNYVFGEFEGLSSLAVTEDQLFFVGHTQNEGTELYVATVETILSVIDHITSGGNNKNFFKIYPNPASTHFTIVSSLNKTIKNVEVLDLSGKTLFKKPINTETAQLKIDNLKAGIYLVKIYYNNTFETKKLLVR